MSIKKEMQPAEPEVRDWELAEEVERIRRKHGNSPDACTLLKWIDHLAAERAEAASWEIAARANADALAEKITQLAATEAELEEIRKIINDY